MPPLFDPGATANEFVLVVFATAKYHADGKSRQRRQAIKVCS